MKKALFSGIFIAVFAMYALYQSFSRAGTVAYVATTDQTQGTMPLATNPAPVTTTTTTTKNTTTTSAPKPTATPTPTPTPDPQPVVKKNLYADGTYTGSVADAYYGNIQVQISITDGKISNVEFLQHPNDRSTSREINDQAMPMLTSEAISAQSANVDIISGATDSSIAFRESLASALDLAKS